MNNTNPVNNIPKWLAIIIAGIGFIIGWTQPLWMAIAYVIVLVIVTFVFLKVRKAFKG